MRTLWEVAVVRSIRPPYTLMIKNHNKNIEIRKKNGLPSLFVKFNRAGQPQLAAPYKEYIYECKKRVVVDSKIQDEYYTGTGKIIGEYIVDRIETIEAVQDRETGEQLYVNNMHFGDKHGLTPDELWNYGKGATLYGLHISNLKIYDEPKAITEMERAHRLCPYYDACEKCGRQPCTLSRPPQGWCYTEELEDGE